MPPVLQATLTEGPVGRHLYHMAMPMVWGLLATMSFNAVDTFFVAQLGDTPLAAMSFTFPVVMVLTSIAIGLGAGTSSAVSRAIGGGDANFTKRLSTDGISLTLLISIFVCLLGWLTMNPLFRLLGAKEQVLPLIGDYMSIWYISAPFLMVPMVTMSSIRAMGHSHVQGYIMTAGAILNAGLDWLLIFGHWGFPRLEIEGAALATLITRFITLVAAFYILQGRMQMLVSPFVRLSTLLASWRAILQVGVPAMLTNVIIPLSSAVVVRLVSIYGTNAVAGLGVALRVEPIALIVFYALSGVVGPFCGQNLGAGKTERLYQALKVSTGFCLSFGIVMAVILWFWGEDIASNFRSTPEVLSVAVLYLTMVPISYGAYGIVMAANAAFNGLGMPLPALAISFLRVLGVYLPLAWLGSLYFELKGLFVATAVANLLAGGIAYLWLRQRFKRLHQLEQLDRKAPPSTTGELAEVAGQS